MNVKPLFKLMVEKKASDLFFAPFAPAKIKIEGKIMPVNKLEMTPKMVKQAALELMTETQMEQFNKAMSAFGVSADIVHRAFDQYFEPVICYLAATREPVSIDQLISWTGLTHRRIKTAIHEWRQFLDEEQDESGKSLYRVYHASFQDFLREDVGLTTYHQNISKMAIDKIDWS